MTKLSEYKNKDKTAQVFYRGDKGDFIGVALLPIVGGEVHILTSPPFASEEAAEDWCEEWILRED